MKHLALILACYLFSTTSFAEPSSTQTKSFASPLDITPVLREQLSHAPYKEQYINQILSTIRREASDQTTLTQKDIDDKALAQHHRARHAQASRTLEYDINFDGVVTKDEALQSLSDRKEYNTELSRLTPEQRLRIDQANIKQVEKVMLLDTNHDGQLTIDEMYTLSTDTSSQQNRAKDHLENLLMLAQDPAKGINVAELKTYAEQAFDTVDSNSDGNLSRDELSRLKPPPETRASRGGLDQASFGGSVHPNIRMSEFPRPTATSDVVVINAYEGETTSNITIAGQETETRIIPITISKGEQKLFVIVSSLSPTIWQIKGDTSRVERFIVIGPALSALNSGKQDRRNPVNAGVVGLPRDIVHFIHSRDHNLQGLWKADQASSQSTHATIQQMIGKEPTSTLTNYGLLSVGIQGAQAKAGQVTAGKSPPPPPGFHERTWQTHLKFTPGGIITIDASDVVSQAPAAAYEVLPNWAGIAKLVKDGAIERSPSGFRIVKDIPYYPSGMYGALSADFIIAKGVSVPEGDRGHSRIVCEDPLACTNEGP